MNKKVYLVLTKQKSYFCEGLTEMLNKVESLTYLGIPCKVMNLCKCNDLKCFNNSETT